jgi:tetratricopeptide (TPR) repeat protein
MQVVNLVTNAKKEEDFELAETWLDKIRDEKVRESATNYFYFSRSKLATKENRFEEARKHAEKVSKIEHRAVLYFDVAEARLKEPTTRLNSLDTLFEVYQMAQKAPETVEKAQVLLGLAYMYEKIDHSNALDSLSNSIKTANKLENPDLFTSFMSHQIIGKDFAVFIGYDVPGFNISETFGEISKADFQNSVQQAEGFTDKYLRTLAILASVKDCENEKPTKAKPKAKIK